ncbi:hypothetical protein BAUCODRAFT_62439 [Baudoinia panamericana UAMH 10762]|uniref:Sfi1 spindle body domain-containing protein n=1 Tax=Baudoinia panamericana (strain UAMH 10762) TaxID=717646 RepID=M2MUB0_BAUPA|nr:uncharacterized protein BAUCODRAFT_62439 [Baudoinia panamericana UAMH 10762]EMD00497.1 hypothetical protein BAUCODRAFT_62439 [Baudoinia panamericana UAMH 10762]
MFQMSQTQLEQNAEAFATTSMVRIARRCLHIMHDRALRLHWHQQHAYATAAAHDRRTLVKQAFDQWRTTFEARKQAHLEEARLKQLDQKAMKHYNSNILWKAFGHWAASTKHQQVQIRWAQQHILRIRYFRRWRTVAVENATKSRSILARKYLGLWRDRSIRRRLREEQALAVREESVLKRCWRSWFWHFCSRRVEIWREERLKGRALTAWTARFRQLRTREQATTRQCNANAARRTMNILRERMAHRHQASQQAEITRNRRITAKCLHVLSIRLRLEPIGRALAITVNLHLLRKAFHVWHVHVSISREAADVDRKRILQSAWTSWNDALRCQALAQKTNERVLLENLYRWVLAERLRLFQRTLDGRLLRRAMSAWSRKLFDIRTRVADAESAFVEAQARRRMLFGMTKLHLAVRRCEDAERAAVEFSCAKVGPTAFTALTQKFRHVQQLGKWSQDARFYTICTRTLSVWRERTTQHQQNRKRDAYARIRARLKVRLVSECLARWRTKTANMQARMQEADQRLRDRVFEASIRGFDCWREKTVQVQQAAEQAAALDIQKLMISALSAMVTRNAELAALEIRASSFRRDTELAILAAALKRVQWAQFTAARRAESAEALWARNRDLHIRNMIRTWVAQTAARRALKQPAVTLPPLPRQRAMDVRDNDGEPLRCRPQRRSLHQALACPLRAPLARPQ